MERTKGVRTAKSSSSSASWSDKHYSWPKHTQSRAYQTFAAVEKRLIGSQIEAEHLSGGAIQEAIQLQSHYIFSHIVNLFAVPDTWPQDEERFLSLQSNIAVGFGLINALLDETGTTYSQLDNDGNHLGKARSIDFSGLLPLQHRWCKAIVQTYILPGLLNTVVGLLYSTLQAHSNDHTFLFPLLVSLSSRLFGWSFVIKEPFAGLVGPVSVDEQTLLLKQDEDHQDDGDDDKASGVADSSSRTAKPNSRSIPESHINFVSRKVMSALYMAYNHAEALEKEKPGESSFYVSELRKALLDVASCRTALQQDSRPETQEMVLDSKRCQLECIQSLMREQEAYSGEGNTTRPHDGIYASSLLFISQLLHCFLTSSNDMQTLLTAVDASTLIGSLSLLTGLVLPFAYEPRADSDEEDDLIQMGDEAVDNVLSSWRLLLPSSSTHAKDELSQHLRIIVDTQVVNPYIKLRLVNAGTPFNEVPLAQSDLGQEVVPDAKRYQEQLIILASLARDADIVSCLRYLSECSTSLVSQLQHFYSQSKPATADDEKQIEGIWEQVHWLTLIAGHIIADQSKGEVATIAQEIADSTEEGQAAVVHVVHTLGFTLLSIFSQPSARIQSPRVTETALWFNARWLPVYLLANTTPFLSVRFSGARGQEMLQYLLVHVQKIVQHWKSDSDVVLQIASVIKSLSLSEGVMQVLLGSSEFQNTVKAITEGLDVLPAKTHGPLISSIVGCIYTSSASQSPEIFFDYIKQAIEQRLSNIIHQPNFASSQVSQRPDTISSLLNALDMLDGLASSVQPKSAAAVYEFLSRFFDTLAGLAQLYHERSEVIVAIIRVYRTLIGALDLGFGAQPHMIIGLNSAVSALLDRVDERSLLGDSPEMALEEDVPFEGLSLVLEMLSDLMLASDNDAADSRLWTTPLSIEQTSDVCLQGFSRVIPLLTEDARSVGKVRRRFAKLTSSLWIAFPHRIAGIAVTASDEHSLHLFSSCITAVVISLGFVESSILIDCFAAIRQLSTAVERVLNMWVSHGISPAILATITESMTRILTTVMNGVLIEPLATSLLDVHLLAIRALLRSLVNDTMGGISALQTRMHQYCSTTNLVSQYSFKVASSQRPFGEQEESKKRSELTSVVEKIATLCLDGQQAASMLSAQGREEEAVFLKEARKVAWEGRAKIRAL
jgi:hypothetical protein